MATRLREFREAKGLSGNELARIAGVSRMTIYKLETGAQQSYTMRTLQKIASALSIPMDELFDMTGNSQGARS